MILISSDQSTETKSAARVAQRELGHLKYVKAADLLILQYNHIESISLNLHYIIF
jgi:hypothetical protein